MAGQLRRIQIGRKIGLAAAFCALAGVCSASQTAAITGIVRDTQGVAQMGAIVQVLANGSVSAGTAFTDMYGRYSITNLMPGKYQVRASAALFMPATRGNLLLATGARATVNLTLSMLSDAASWLPAQRRRPDEPGDDWTWTLRSAANRPILRMLDDGQMVMVSSSSSEASANPSVAARASMTSGDGGFGGGGSHDVLSIDRVMEDGSDVVLRTDFASGSAPYGHGPAMAFDAGYEREIAFAGVSRVVVSFQSHPEMMSGNRPTGLQTVRMASAQKMKLGDAIDVETGGALYSVHTIGYAIASRPFLKVDVHPGDVWSFQYRMATARDVQSFNSLDSVGSALPLAAMSDGKLRTESGMHQEIAVSHKAGAGLMRAALYRDSIHHSAIAGVGVLAAADLTQAGPGIVADTMTQSFELLSTGYTSRGVSLMMSEPLTANLWGVVEYQNGSALSTRDAYAVSLPETLAGMHAISAEAATAALNGQLLRSRTKLQVAYRWQPRRVVTPVASYEAFSDQAFLSCYVRQTLRWGHRFPPGFAATMDVTNLLAQGYQPFLSADGHTMLLAESPRTVQGGFSFTF